MGACLDTEASLPLSSSHARREARTSRLTPRATARPLPSPNRAPMSDRWGPSFSQHHASASPASPARPARPASKTPRTPSQEPPSERPLTSEPDSTGELRSFADSAGLIMASLGGPRTQSPIGPFLLRVNLGRRVTYRFGRFSRQVLNVRVPVFPDQNVIGRGGLSATGE